MSGMIWAHLKKNKLTEFTDYIGLIVKLIF